MAAPRFAPTADNSRYYSSPDVVPRAWSPDKPGIVDGLQPQGDLLGSQGPDQGFALTIANLLVPDLYLQPGETANDAVRGCLGIALRRASLLSRAPVVHDVRLAFTIWGFFEPDPPDELVARRRELFEGVGIVNHHYAEARRISDLVPEATLKLTPDEAAKQMPASWRDLTGA